MIKSACTRVTERRPPGDGALLMRRNGFCPPRQQMFFRVFEVSKDCYPARSFGARIQSSTRTTGNEEADRLRCEVEAQGCPPHMAYFRSWNKTTYSGCGREVLRSSSLSRLGVGFDLVTGVTGGDLVGRVTLIGTRSRLRIRLLSFSIACSSGQRHLYSTSGVNRILL